MTVSQSVLDPSTIKPPPRAVMPNASAPATVPTTIIEPRPGWKALDLRELWRYRELLYFFAWRDVKVRYKQTMLGAAWAIIQPFMMMVVFTIFLGKMAAVSSGGLPYPIFVYAGLLPWSFFSTAIASAGNSVINQQQLITKVYFPRLSIPFSAVGAAMVDFGIAFSVLLAMMVYYGIAPGWWILLVPALVGLATLAALGVGTVLAALNVSYRDFRYVIPFLVQVWMFATPAIYMKGAASPQPVAVQAASRTTTQSASAQRSAADSGSFDQDFQRPTAGMQKAPAWVRVLVDLNPMTGLISFFRASTLGGDLPWRELGFSTVTIVAVFVAGCVYFRRVEDSFADII